MNNEIIYKAKVICIEELQFFPIEIVEMCEDLVLNGGKIFAACLDTNFMRKEWPVVVAACNIANKIVKLTSTCDFCHNTAIFSLCIVEGLNPNEPNTGAGEKYKATCRRCYLEKTSS